jgi:hypothetical protein
MMRNDCHAYARRWVLYRHRLAEVEWQGQASMGYYNCIEQAFELISLCHVDHDTAMMVATCYQRNLNRAEPTVDRKQPDDILSDKPWSLSTAMHDRALPSPSAVVDPSLDDTATVTPTSTTTTLPDAEYYDEYDDEWSEAPAACTPHGR